MHEYDFSIEGVIRESLRRTYGLKWTFVGAILIYILIETFLKVGFILALPSIANLAGLIILPVTLPILVGIMILAIRVARDESVEIKDIFYYYPQVLFLLGAYLLVLFATILGFVFLILPGIYLSVSYIFTLSLVADKGLGIWEAMELSRKTVTQRWWKFFGLSITLTLLLLISAIPLGIGLIWTIPMTYLTHGLLYHRLFDDEEDEIINEDENLALLESEKES